MNQKTFMVIDDDAAVRKVLERYFRKKDIRVLTAADGVSALRMLETEKPNLILLDIRMPDMDGLEVLHHLRSLGSTIPVIMVSAVDDLETAKQAMALGAKDYIKKPIDLEYLDTSSTWLSWLSE